jgi:hypothetical protein
MKYEKPEVVVLTSAIDVIQGAKDGQPADPDFDTSPAYEDWE